MKRVCISRLRDGAMELRRTVAMGNTMQLFAAGGRTAITLAAASASS